MDDKNWTEENQKDYIKLLKRYCENFQKSMDVTGNNSGFMILFVRKPEEGCIDIVNNMDRDTAIMVLEESLKMVKDQWSQND